jgi:hypothetical protein
MKKGTLISISDEALAVGAHDSHEYDESSLPVILAEFRRDWQPADSREEALVKLMAIGFRNTVRAPQATSYAAIASFVVLYDRLMKMQEFRLSRELDRAA